MCSFLSVFCFVITSFFLQIQACLCSLVAFNKPRELRCPRQRVGRSIFCVVKQIVIAREDGTERESEILAKFHCLLDSLLPTNDVGLMRCGTGG